MEIYDCVCVCVCYSYDLAALGSCLSEQTEAGILVTHHFANWSFVLLGCIIKTSL